MSAPTRAATRQTGVLRTLHEKFVVEERFVTPRDRRNLYLAAGILAVSGIALFTFLLVSVLNGTGPALLDKPVQEWFTARRDAAATPTMIVLAVIFGPIGMPILVLAFTVGWGLLARHAWRPLVLSGGMLVGVVTALTIAPLVGRSRPPVDLMLFGADRTFSFPSGHVLGVCDFFLITAFLIVSRRGGKRAAAVGFVVAALSIGIQIVSRLYLGYHWLTDTLASFSISLVVLAIVITVDTWRTVRVPGERVSGALSVEQGRDADH